jgi:hypothetical protein
MYNRRKFQNQCESSTGFIALRKSCYAATMLECVRYLSRNRRATGVGEDPRCASEQRSLRCIVHYAVGLSL